VPLSRQYSSRLLLQASRAALASWIVLGSALLAAEPAIDFGRDIKPILSDTCYKCHGPDEDQRQAELRLDQRKGAFAPHHDPAVLVPGDLQASALWQRVSSQDPDFQMPPHDSGRSLSSDQRELLGRWIKQGARWDEHWSFAAPQRAALPSGDNWARNAIDTFTLARMQLAGLKPSPPAAAETLARRLSLDLTGLPISQQQLDAYLADSSPAAYERLLDQLLDSPRYGERMAVEWLDAARYADTSGYQTDGERHMWRWRDWVVASFNQNQPFDEFTIEQLAGDQLENPSSDQLLATGFNRNHRANSEGGIVFEEYLIEYAVDRVETTFMVWQGLTMGCARCHNHKYDPITNREFYQLMAFFNNVPERGRVIKYGNSFPLMRSPTGQMMRQLTGLQQDLDRADDQLAQQQQQVEHLLAAWGDNYQPRPEDDVVIQQGLAVRISWDGLDDIELIDPQPDDPPADDTPAADEQPAGSPLSIVGEGAEVSFSKGLIGQALDLPAGRFVEGAGTIKFTGSQPLTLSTWLQPRSLQSGTIMSFLNTEDARATGFSWKLVDNHVQVNFGPRWLDDAIIIRSKQTLPVGEWSHLALVHDGSQLASGLQLYINGERQDVDVLLDIFTGDFTTSDTLQVGSEGGSLLLDGRLDETRVYQRALKPQELAVLACSDSIQQICRLAAAERSVAQQAKLRHLFLDRHAPQQLQQLFHARRDRQQKLESARRLVPTVMVMQESADPRRTYMLERGQYDKPGEEVTAAIPSWLDEGREQAVQSRLDLARWLVSERNPLTARVTMNRFWSLYFGRGLVRTLEDFGSQGEMPSHPQLLDWLAVEFVESGWDVKQLQRLIVSSATYRQSSQLTAKKLAADPENIWLSRAPRLRLKADVVRDQALAVSGLLIGPIGGPSVKPYQPEGLWAEISSQVYVRDDAESLYRRSMYTFWKRTVPPPLMMTFDASSREICVLTRSRTNTPLQALALLNDVTFVESARRLAAAMMLEGGVESTARLNWGFRQLTARRPTKQELQILQRTLGRALERYQQDPEAAAELVGYGESPVDPQLDTVQLAAYASVANLMMNLDEVINRE